MMMMMMMISASVHIKACMMREHVEWTYIRLLVDFEII